jgi:DDE superfamily endonuclease
LRGRRFHRDGAASAEKNDITPWAVKTWCIPPEADGEFVCHMEDVLATYALPYDPAIPVVCMDEASKQLIGEVNTPLPIRPGQPKCVDCEYERRGVCSEFIFCEPKAGWRHVTVTERRTKKDWAACIRELVDVHYPHANKIRLVLDNLNTHTGASLYEAFAPDEARRILERLEFHYTPKHASWLNMAEIEIGIMNRQCLDRRIDTIAEIRKQIAAWEKARNRKESTIHWTFTIAAARRKLSHLYPSAEG